ncbi:MAG TPA: RNA-binding cell elongation regulator Jag/EloR, partial [Anaerolineales bacterium]|nr:RNA-binding cell elongation regulator Jag/EloR [Anaerolineales bacterium]
MTENRAFLEMIAANVEDAVARGLFELGVREEDVDVEVLDNGDPAEGRQARVRLTVRPEEADPDEGATGLARAALHELLGKMRVRARVSTRWEEPADDGEERSLVLNVLGDDLGMLIGHKGETLSALQYITRVIIAKRLGQSINIVVDVENYKSRREEQLKRLARRLAEQAAQQGRTLSLEPMPPNERRIIHLALRDHTDVMTESVGEGRTRKVT